MAFATWLTIPPGAVSPIAADPCPINQSIKSIHCVKYCTGTVINTYSNHSNVRHIDCSPLNLGIFINYKNHYKYKNTIRWKHPVAMTIQTGNEIIE